MAFTLDTSGIVGLNLDGKVDPDWMNETAWTFASLPPFTQGYTVPVLESVGAAFWQLAPETLARIIADCEAIQATFPVSPNREGGWQAWCVRRDGGFDMGGKWPGLPPLTVTLGDDGKVRFAA